MANRNLNTYLIGAFLGSVALKVFEVFLLAGSLVSLNSMDLNNALTVVRADPFQMPYIAISAASSLLLGILIIFIGLALRKGKLMTIPQKEEEKF
ncbi:hypothetical protein IX51_08755 [uncultured archaeon]|nr:hypothetical protein IX51_08755 [uncultured archaeon]